MPNNIRRTQMRQMWYAPVLAIAMGLMLIRLLVMARIFDLPSYATYSAGLLVSSSFLMLGCLGLQSLLQRELPMLIVRRRKYAGGVLLMQCALVAITCLIFAAVVVLIYGISIAGLPPSLFVLALIHGLSSQLFLVATIDSRSRGQTLFFAFQNLGRALLSLTASVTVATFGGGAAAVLATEAAISILLAVWLLRKQFRAIPIPLAAASILAWHRFKFVSWRSSFALLGVATVGFLLLNADRWLAAQWLPSTAFGQYSFAWMILLVAQSLQALINASLFPMLARRFSVSGGRNAFQLTAKVSLFLLTFGTISTFPLWAFMDYAVERWFVSYQESRGLLPIFLFISVLRIADFWTSYLIVAGCESRLLLINIFGVILTVILWVITIQPEADTLRTNQVAFLALLLALVGNIITALDAWNYSKRF